MIDVDINHLNLKGAVVPYTPPEQMPEDLDALDTALGKVYQEGVEDGKRNLRLAIREFLRVKFYGTKGRERRANPEDPKTAAVLWIMEKLYAAFEDGSL